MSSSLKAHNLIAPSRLGALEPVYYYVRKGDMIEFNFKENVYPRF